MGEGAARRGLGRRHPRPRPGTRKVHPPRWTLRPYASSEVGGPLPGGYVSPQASQPVEIMSRYEWGVDTLNGKEIYPAHVERGRYIAVTFEFTLKLNPNNFGVLLRRTLDYSFPNQRAEVYVGDPSPARPNSDEPQWQRAGVWYLAGSNTCVYSNPK